MTQTIINSKYEKQGKVDKVPQLTASSRYEKITLVYKKEAQKEVRKNKIEEYINKDKKYCKNRSASFENNSISNKQYINIDQNLLNIKTYFNAFPKDRVIVQTAYARNIQKIQEVLIVLSLGHSPNFQDNYNGAIGLLAKCNQDVLSQSVEFFRQRLIQQHLTTSEEKNLKILIKSVACASFVESARKLGLISTLFVKNLSSVIKLALISAIISLKDEVDNDLIIIYLERFSSKKEPDESVRMTAQKAISENQQNKQEQTLYDKFMDSGLIGCCSIDEDLSTTYKQVLSDSLDSKYDHS